MRLVEIASGSAAPVALAQIGLHPDLAGDVQARLGEIGLLDPPVDRKFGQISQWALGVAAQRLGLGDVAAIDKAVATRLSSADAAAAFPLQPGSDLAGRLVKAMQRRGDWIQRAPGCVNIVYVEGMNPDGSRNDNAPNQFDDLRVALKIGDGGVPAIAGAWEGTTEPGRHFTEHPMDPKGAARISFGQYKSWAVGTHLAGKPSAHEALVQVEAVTVFRDLNKDFKRQGDQPFTGLFGVNQHWGYDLPKRDLGNSSAGCLVGRSKDGHIAFMKLLKDDPRYQMSHAYHFVSSVLAAADIA